MQVIRSKYCGYCSGVARVVSLAESCLRAAQETHVSAYSIGPIIHNPQVVEHLTQRGLRVINHPDDGDPGIAVIRAHGITDALRRSFFTAGYTLLDGTCSRVAASQNLVREAASLGKHPVVIGISGHSETITLSGTEDAKGNLIKPSVVSRVCDVSLIPSGIPLQVVVQTTFGEEQYQEIRDAILAHFSDTIVEIQQTICSVSTVRREEVRRLCATCDALLIIGGRNSANTKSLAQTAQACGKIARIIETEKEIDDEIRSHAILGLISGASTPIERVDAVCRALGGCS